MTSSAPGSVDVTVAVCTFNRADQLRRTLETLGRMTVPDDLRWELIVVNNRCTDDTDAVLSDFMESLPLRRLYEEVPGKSNAANTAVREARGEYIVWTDDDVLVEADWLSSYWDAFRSHPDTSIFGGTIHAHFVGTPPGWVEEWALVDGRIWAAFDPGDDVRPLTREEVPLGANMALRREMHLRCPFDPRIGPRPSSEIRGEETLVIHTLMDQGEHGLWIPSATVRHIVPPERQTIRYFRDFFAGLGETDAILQTTGDALRIFGKPAWAIRQVVQHEALYRWWRLLGNQDRWLEALIATSYARGYLAGC